MFKAGDQVQFSKFGARGLKGYVRDVKPGWALVRWNTRDTEWVRQEDLVRLPEERMRQATREMRKAAGEILKVAEDVLRRA